MISNYKSFLDDHLILESLREMKFVLSRRLREQLAKINHVISDELLKLHNDLDSLEKQTFVDICEDKDDKLSFIQANKASDLLALDTEEKYDKLDKSLLDDLSLSSPVYKQFRTEVGVGRFVNLLFGASRFPAASRAGSIGKLTDVESFVNMYKATFGQEDKFKLLEVVSGDMIPHWYHYSRYHNEEGSMGSSCMNNVDPDYFDIYADSSNVGMLVFYSSESKRRIRARAIVWKNLIEPADRTYMDRIYTNNSSDEQLFKEYAKKQGWLYKSHQGYGADSNIIDSVDDSNTRMTLIGQVEATDYNEYPYMDTMVYFNPDNGQISNKESHMKYVLQDTGGGHDTTRYHDEEEVWSEYHNRDIYKSEAKWCDFGQDWVLDGQAIKVWNTDNKFAVPGNPDVVKSFIPNMIDKHFEKSRCTWSDFLNTWIFNGALINVWTDLGKTNSVVEYKKRSGITFAEVDGEFWKMDLVEKVGSEYKLKGETVESVKRPVNAPRGWHRMSEFTDDQGNMFRRGKFAGRK